MNQHLQTILSILQQDASLNAEQKNALIKSLKDADKEFEITAFKLDRTEKVKRTTAILLEETIEELEQKRKAVEAQNHELQIESALERVRTVAMGMHKQADLMDICKAVYAELQTLGFSELRNTLIDTFVDEKKYFIDYDYSEFSGGSSSKIPYSGNPVVEKYIEDIRKSGEAFFEITVKGAELEAWKKFRRENGEIEDPRLNDLEALYYYKYSVGPGSIGISTYSRISQEKLNILHRFRNVFNLSYQRYADITKAEAQAYEAKIETSLERVRAQAMAMHKSDDLLDVCETLCKEFHALGFAELRNAMINIHNDDNRTFVNYDYSDEIGRSINHLTNDIHPVIENQIRQVRSADDAFSETVFAGEDLDSWKTFRKKVGEKDDPRIEHCDALYYYFYSIGEGSIGISTFEPIGEEKLEMLKRFRNVFSLAYRRYIDIKKAEAQAREAQIQLALERVRARTMAMQRSEELNQTASEMFKQIQVLGMQPWGCGFNIFDKDERAVTQYMSLADGGISPPFRTPLTEDPFFISIYEARKRRDELLVMESSGESLAETYRYMFGLPGSREIFGDLENSGFEMPKFQITHCAYFSQGYLVFITYVHVPEAHDIFKRFAKVFEQTYTRFLDLQKAEAQAREAQIEAALERVRSRSMAMQKSEELKEVIQVVYDQLVQLNLPVEHTGFMLDYKNRNDYNSWIADHLGSPSNIVIPYFDSVYYNRFNESKKQGLDFFAVNLNQKEKNKFYLDLFEHLPGFPEASKEFILKQPALTISTVLLDNVALYIENFSGTPYSDEENTVLMRFGKAFQQTYTRFLDLQRAEAQAREAQIEAALERVRSRSMAMHKSDELLEAGEILFVEMQKLGIESLTAGYVLMDKDAKKGLNYMPDPSTKKMFQLPVIIPHNETVHLQQVVENWKKGKPFFIVEMDEEETIKHQTFIAERSTNFTLNAEQLIAISPAKLVLHNFYFKEGYLLIVGGIKLSVEQTDIMLRFTKVFQQTYTRFLDLQKAEAQAREALIEAALERIRARAMAMHKSEELKEAAILLYRELQSLGIKQFFNCGYVLIDEKNNIQYAWMTHQDGTIREGHSMPLTGDWVMNERFESWKRKDPVFLQVVGGEQLKFHLDFVSGNTDAAGGSDNVLSQMPDPTVFYCGNFSEGYLHILADRELSKESEAILPRFASVFEITFRRFLDLQKAEAQAREARIEAGLERVRSRTLAMQSSNELAETAAVLFQQLMALGIEPNRLYISIIKGEMGEAEFWITDEDGSKVSTAFTTNMNDNATLLKMYAGWKQEKKSLVIDMQGEELETYFRYLSGLGVPFKGGLTQKRRVQDIAYFSKGFIGIASPDDQPVETIVLLERFAAVFNLTFTRFNDLQIAEAHAAQAELDLIAIKEAKQKAEEALGELQATQKQLIQSEKMASLGELTAGIAHEIQNPLNFVNNFSEVSKELLDEMKEAIEKGDTEEAKEIMQDVIQNLEKINHHGKRADAIVKGMLQHSRSSSGQKEPTDINALCDEYLRLAYHGLRAKDKTFNAKFESDFDASIGKVNVIPQDIGRVILNLINNAFYVVNEKKKKNITGYEPTVMVSTRRVNDKVEISVRDNGNGIPAKVLDKIFQPFFTTKPTGEGTGLGLSLSYDIITKGHGGELKVETSEGIGSEFIISLPIQ